MSEVADPAKMRQGKQKKLHHQAGSSEKYNANVKLGNIKPGCFTSPISTTIENITLPNNTSTLNMALHPTTILTPLLALLSLYAAQKSYIAITNLQQYEEPT